MDIIVPIKQVPGTMLRAGVETVVNPLDLYAVETALQVRERFGGNVTVLTMGPPPAEKALREAIAMGCDDGILISDRKFGDADTWATSYTLAQAIRSLERYDLIIAGERATDGDTAQVGPGIAAWLDVPLATYVSSVDMNDSKAGTANIMVERLVEEGYQILELPLPALITVVKEIASPRLPTLRGKKRARSIEIPLYNSENMELNTNFLGLKGSPTKVVRIATPKVTRRGTVVHARDEGGVSAVDQLMDFLDGRDLLPTGGRS